MSVRDLGAMTWLAFKALDKRTVVAILPLGAIEAHGPHLPLGTDIVIAQAMARAGAERLSRRGLEAVVLPAIPVAPAPFAAAFDGTLHTPAEATTALIVGVAQSLGRSGVRILVVVNAHHDPAHVDAIRAAVTAAGNDAATIVFPDLTKRRWAEQLTDEFRSGACHAGRYEGSIVLAEAAHLVDTARLATLPANPRSLVDAIRRGDATFADAGGPDAYFGWPAEATAAEGRAIIDRLGAVVETAVVTAMGMGMGTVANEERRTKNEERNGERRTKNGNEERSDGEPKNEEHGNEELPRAASMNLRLQSINPPGLGRPAGFSHGVLGPVGSRVLSVAGQTATDASGSVVVGTFADQFRVALERVIAVVHAAGAVASDISRMTIYVTDLEMYRESRPQLGVTWTALMGRHYPAMALVEVQGLVDRGAMVEIEADAMLPVARGT